MRRTTGLLAAVVMLGGAHVAAAQRMDDSASRPKLVVPPPPPPPIRNVKLAFVDSLKHPESVLYDAEQDVYFVSNIDGPSLQKDGRGFLSRLSADGSSKQLRWVNSGAGGAMLNAPKGMAIVGDTLWVSDISVMRAFNRRTGAVVAIVDLTAQGAQFLNDVTVGPDGSIYVTDTSMEPLPTGNMRHSRADRIYRIQGRTASVALETDRLARPNGIAWDRANSRFVIVPFGGDTIMGWKPGTTALEPIATGPGQYDGVTFTSDGRMLVSSKATAAIHELRGGMLVKIIDRLNDPADIEFDAKHDRLAVPMTGANRVEWFRVPNP